MVSSAGSIAIEQESISFLESMGHMNGGHLTLVRVENGRRIFDSSELIKSFGNEFYKMFQKMIVPYQKLQQNSTSL